MMILGIWMAELKKSLRLVYRRPGDLFNLLLFLGITSMMFPLAITPDSQLLRKLAPGVLWIMTLLSLLLSQDRIFKEDQMTGILEQYLIQDTSLYFVALIKVINHWLIYALPLLLVTPVLGALWQLSFQEIIVLEASLCLGTPVVICLIALLNAFALGDNARNILVPLLLFPLIAPVIIFGAGMVPMVSQGVNITPYLMILMSLSLVSLSLCPIAIAFSLRINHY